VVLTCRRIQLYVGESEAKLFQYAVRRCIRRVMTGKKRVRANRIESIRDDGTGCIFGQTFVPVRDAKVEAEFVDFFFDFVGSQAGAANEIVILQQEYGPILNVVRSHRGDFFIEAGFYLILRKRAADPAHDFGVAPKSLGER
jgi:hypothetical protein